jgi:mannose-1-phosphate guanylyltransferase
MEEKLNKPSTSKTSTPQGGAASSVHAVILAGGRGTRFWPRSRLRTPKQLLNIVGSRTMLEQTVQRLLPLFPYPRLWVVTNAEQARDVRRLVPRFRAAQVLAEPLGRNTAAAIGLAAIHLAKQDRNALMAVLPADHFIADAENYRRVLEGALEVAARGPNLVVLGIPPTRPETGYGYIELDPRVQVALGNEVFRVRGFTEKPSEATARGYLASGNYYWNAGMFFWRAATFLDCLKRFLPGTYEELDRLAATIGTRRYAAALRRAYPKLDNISVDYAVMEPATRQSEGGNVFVLPAQVGWSDIGSWAAVYELGTAGSHGANVCSAPLFTIDSAGNYIWSTKKLVAAIGVNDLVVVETPDALLLCPRNRAQDVGKVVKWLEERKMKGLL